ncbi:MULTISPECIES: hypothetical protein [Pseudomonas]|uniref:hypothetical protein n=1 Tax=Pseudomonas TaxID=286 RepID=UPI000B828349|nr:MULTISPECIES: hypothetical protein [Pseudomonas]PMV17288.1 hypothetical protein C1X17_30060 [Pseudomonas sp. FW305-3-2-15-C-TSA2]PMV17905.1 hypothetical protein C1X22_30075 [Pseudomonas sp. DP16D-L5]PMV36483.1 hypothetical protein C1X21_24050 [Pseudomonas sp. FW305-3-2-15-A-LB2]PMV37252.1 hypothetical protein C1X16_30095 [Pseudomonas sp. FW305-3-2-15-C-R2A1]PMV45180.1 hypothetical protein C1X19_30075 [Pseudomonas sp. GW460-4]
MKIKIIEAMPDAETLLVSFHSPAGSGTALWVGIAPNLGDEVDVEFDLDEIFSWGKNITPSSSKVPKISHTNGVTQITAELIHASDKDCAALKLGGSVLLIELDGPVTQKSGYVDVRATRVLLYPTNI